MRDTVEGEMSESVDKKTGESQPPARDDTPFHSGASIGSMLVRFGGYVGSLFASVYAGDVVNKHFEPPRIGLPPDAGIWQTFKKDLGDIFSRQHWKSNVTLMTVSAIGFVLTDRLADKLQANKYKDDLQTYKKEHPNSAMFKLAENRSEPTSVQAAEHHGTVAATEKAVGVA